MIKNNWEPLSITVNCGGGTDTTALVEEIKDNEKNDILLSNRITSLETQLTNEIKDRINVDTILSDQFYELYRLKASEDRLTGDSPPISNFTRVSGTYKLIRQGTIVNLFLDTFVYDCTIPNDGKNPHNTQTIFEIPLNIMMAFEPGRRTILGQATVSIAGDICVCTLSLVENYITIQTPDPVLFNGVRLAIYYLPISFAL